MWEYSNSTIAPLATIASLTASPSGLQGKSSKEPHPREAMIGTEEKQPKYRPVDIKKESRCLLCWVYLGCDMDMLVCVTSTSLCIYPSNI